MRTLILFLIACACYAQGIPFHEIDFYGTGSTYTALSVNSAGQTITVGGTAGLAALDVQNGYIASDGGLLTSANIWNGIHSNSDGIHMRGYVVEQNTANTAGGYQVFVPLSYNPNGGGSCFDIWANPVYQPMPLPSAGSLASITTTGNLTSGNANITSVANTSGILTSWTGNGPTEVTGDGIPAGDYVTGVSGSTVTLFLAPTKTATGSTLYFFNNNDIYFWNSPSPSVPFSGTCGPSLPANTLYGVNTNGYLFARGGLATDMPYFNSVQSLTGGVIGRALFTSDYLNGPAASNGLCSPKGSCGGAYYNTDGSAGVPTPLSGDTFHGGAFYWDTSLSQMRLYNGSTWHSVLTDTLSYVSSIGTSTGISASGSTGSVTLTNTGVTSISASAPLSASASTGSVTLTCSGCGGGSASAASPTASVQFNAGSNTFGGSSSFTWDNTNLQLTIAQGASGSQRGYIGDVFNSTAANDSTSHAIQTQGGTFVIYGDGHAAFSHSVTVGGNAFVDGVNSVFKCLALTNSGSNRFDVCINNDTEGGSNTGSNFSITRLDDTGGLLDRPITINRQTGVTTFADPFVFATATSAPSCGSLANGYSVFDTANNTLYICNGGTATTH